MRRGALRACALLLRSSGGAVGAASQPTALLAVRPAATAAAAGGLAVRQQLWPAWLQATLHSAAPDRRQAAQGGSSDSDSDAGVELVNRSTGGSRGKPIPVRPQLAAELRPLAALAGVADAAELSRKVAALGPKREQGVLEHSTVAAQWLLSLGVPRPQLAQLLRRCPYLFSQPANERLTALLGRLAQLGLTAAQAARCFEQMPTAANVRSFDPAIAVLAALFAAGSKEGGGSTGEQLLGDLLRKQPSAVGLLTMQPSLLQERISNLVQRYGPHWGAANKQAVVVAATWEYCLLLSRPPKHLLALEAVLQQELGQQPSGGTRLLASIVQHKPRAAVCSPERLPQRLLALLAEFGREALLQAGPAPLADLLGADSATWQRALAVWRLLGVADPASLGLWNTRPLTRNWLKPERLASLASLQRLLPWQPTTEQAVQQHGGYVANYAPARLIGRLLFLQQEGALLLLVADKTAAQQQWRDQREQQSRQPADQPQLISLRETAALSDAKFCAMVQSLEVGQAEQPGTGGSGSGSNSGIAERYRAFMAQLPQVPAYQRLLAEGAAESRRLAAALPPELLPAAGKGGRSKRRGATGGGS